MQLSVCPDMETYQESLGELALDGKTVALVPTMGALHAGHITLINEAKTLADAVAVSIFVNPKQFGPNEDFAKYPRTLERDLELLAEAGVAVAYTPTVDDLYPEGFSTIVSTGELGAVMEGKFRPGFFDGVATVVTKLLLRTLPHVVVFGEKDYQQLCVIRRVASDLDISVDIIGVPTVREADGLALSSRNVYLGAKERALAPKLYEALKKVRDAIIAGSKVDGVIVQGIAALTQAGFRVDYLELRESDTLEAVDPFDGDARLLVAAWLGNTRLIDNIVVE